MASKIITFAVAWSGRGDRAGITEDRGRGLRMRIRLGGGMGASEIEGKALFF